MAWRPAAVIARKELVEALRDRKTLLVMIVLPLLLYPLVFIGFSQASLAQRDALEREALAVGLAGGPPPAGLLGRLRALEDTEVVEVPDAAAAVREGRVRAALDVPPAARALVDDLDQVPVTVVFDGSDDRSREAQRRVERAIAAWVGDVRAARLREAGLRAEFVDPVRLSSDNVAPPARQGGWLLGQILPMLVSFLMIGAAFYPAIDLTAGEKERGTLQTLLTAPVPALAIVAGKFAAVVVLALLTGLVNLLSVALVAVSMPLPAEVAESISFSVTPGAFLLVLACLVALGMMFGAVMMAVAVTARSFKDAQNYLTPIYLLCVFPLMLSALPGVQLTPATAAVPVVNLALAMKQVLLGEQPAGLLAVVFASTAAWTALGLALAARVFRMEGVLLGTEGPRALFHRRLDPASRPPVPSLGEAATLLAGVLLLLFYGSLALASAPLLVIIHATQWLFLGAPAVALVVALRLDPARSLGLRRPPAWAMVAAVLCGGGLWYVALRVMEALVADWLPVPSPQLEALGEAFTALGARPGTAALLFLGAAVAPALCEEVLFRGVVLHALLPRVSAPAAVGVTAGLFALYHMNVHQLPTTFAVGLVLGALVAASGSLWPAVLLHLLHNALALGAQLYLDPAVLHAPAMLLLLLLPAAGLALLARAARLTTPRTA